MSPNVRAERYAILKSWTTCHACSARIPVSALLLPRVVLFEDDEWQARDDSALLTYIEGLDTAAMELWVRKAPWMRFAPSKTAGLTYLSNVCHCGALQGDYYLREVDGPFFPQDTTAIEATDVEWIEAPIEATANLSFSTWTDQLIELHPYPGWQPPVVQDRARRRRKP